jgi:predicted DNA-binding protein
MPTLKRRLNVTIPNPEFEKSLAVLAEKNQIPQATMLIKLAQMGMEEQEDYLIAKKIEQRMKENPTPKLISHEEFWDV